MTESEKRLKSTQILHVKKSTQLLSRINFAFLWGGPFLNFKLNREHKIRYFLSLKELIKG